MEGQRISPAQAFAQPARESQIRQSMTKLSAGTLGITERLSAIIDRIEPILRPVPPDVQRPGAGPVPPPMPPMCDHARLLEELVMALAVIELRLQNIQERLEL